MQIDINIASGFSVDQKEGRNIAFGFNFFDLKKSSWKMNVVYLRIYDTQERKGKMSLQSRMKNTNFRCISRHR